jgi:hypothetical protein
MNGKELLEFLQSLPPEHLELEVRAGIDPSLDVTEAGIFEYCLMDGNGEVQTIYTVINLTLKS